MEEQISYAQLIKLEANPHYNLSEKQQALLAQYKAERFKNNPNFAKHPTKLEETDGKSDNN